MSEWIASFLYVNAVVTQDFPFDSHCNPKLRQIFKAVVLSFHPQKGLEMEGLAIICNK